MVRTCVNGPSLTRAVAVKGGVSVNPLNFTLVDQVPVCHLFDQNKDLRSRVSHLEGSQRANQDAVVSKLHGRIQELEERLQVEER